MHFLFIILISALSGVFAGMGMGGGTFLIPLLEIIFHINQIKCQSTNVIVFIVLAIICSVIYIVKKLIVFRVFICVVIPASVVAIFASIFALKINSNLLTILFACFIVLLGVFYFIRSIVLMKKQTKKK